MISRKKHMLIAYPIILVLLIVDQVTKYLTTNKYFTLIDNIFSVYYSQNTGAAWSLFSGNVIVLAIISVLFLAILIIFSHKFKEKNAFYSVGYALIIAGALGNLYDRIIFGFVRDFIKTDFINFPIFNIADICLVLGVILFSSYVLFVYPILIKREENKELKHKIQELNEKLSVDFYGNYTEHYLKDFLATGKLKEENILSLAYIDVNNLKEINDTQGHEEGNKYLKIISSNLAKIFNFVFRVGGDEFICLSKKLPEEINITDQRFGIGVVKLEDKDFNESVLEAEKAMYEDKKKKKLK